MAPPAQTSQRLSKRFGDTPTHIFSDSDAARECDECGRSFVPEEDYHDYCGKCWDRKQRGKPRSNESGTQWVERMYGGARTGR